MICIRSMPGRMYGVHCTRQSVIHYVLAGRLYTTNNNRHVRCVIVLYAFMGQTRFCFYYYFHFWSNCCCARACCGRHFEVGQCAVCVGSHDLWGRNWKKLQAFWLHSPTFVDHCHRACEYPPAPLLSETDVSTFDIPPAMLIAFSTDKFLVIHLLSFHS